MDFQYCPNCQAFNPQGVTHCEQCKAELPPDEPAPPASASAVEPAAALDAPTAAPLLAEPVGATPPAPPPLEAAPEVLERVRHLEAEIAKKPGANALYLQLSQLFADAKRNDLAIRTLERCLERDPRNAYLRHRLEQLGGPPAARPLPGVAATAVRTPGAASSRPPTAKVAMPLRPVYHRPAPGDVSRGP